MKQGLESVEALLDRASNLAARKRDYVSDVRNTHMTYEGDDVFRVFINGEVAYKTNDNVLQQMSQWAHLPMSYINYMRDNGQHQLVADNFNKWFEKPVTKSTRRLYRGLAGEYSSTDDLWRSFHSDKFQRIDHEHILGDLLPQLEELVKIFGEIKIVSCAITDNKMYLKILFPEQEAKVVGDVVQMGLVIGNSEIGKSNVYILPLAHILRCLNGMVLPHSGIKRRHIGSSIESDGIVTYAEDTLEANLKAIRLQLRDSMNDIMGKFQDGTFVQELRESNNTTPAKEPFKAVEATAKLFNLTDGEKEKTKLSFARLGNYTKWGMMNAVTEVANTHESYDRASDLEVMGGKIITMPNRDWDRIALAA